MESENLDKAIDQKIGDYKNSHYPLSLEHMLEARREGKRRGDPCRVPAMDEVFCWMKTFTYCFTGHPGFGKSEFVFFLSVLKSHYDGWKWAIWSPEMMSSAHKKVNAFDIYDQLAWIYLGQPVDQGFCKRYDTMPASEEDYLRALEFVKEHFVVIYPKHRKYTDLIDNYLYWHDHYEFDGFIADPFKNISLDSGGRLWNVYLEDIFADFSDAATRTDSVIAFVAHPKSPTGNSHKNEDGSYKVCDQFMLAGGSAWNNSMDAILSMHRPNYHTDFKDPWVEFYSLKWRKQEYTARPGIVENIRFGFKEKRYYFDGHCPFGGQELIKDEKAPF